MIPDWFADLLPNTLTQPVGKYLYRRAIENPYRNVCEIDGRKWTMLAPSKKYSSDTTCHEPPVTKKLLKEFTSDSVFWDVGGHIGYFSVLALKEGGVPAENIHVFEADKSNAKMIEKNMQDGGGDEVNIVNRSVGSSNSEHLSLDKYAEENSSPDIVKIDAGPSSGEKSAIETDIMQGMEHTIENHSPTIFVEVHLFMEDYGNNLKAIQDVLDGNGYEYEYCRNVDRNDSSWVSIEAFDELPTEAKREHDHFMLLCH